jgi:hypothetical protein
MDWWGIWRRRQEQLMAWTFCRLSRGSVRGRETSWRRSTVSREWLTRGRLSRRKSRCSWRCLIRLILLRTWSQTIFLTSKYLYGSVKLNTNQKASLLSYRSWYLRYWGLHKIRLLHPKTWKELKLWSSFTWGDCILVQRPKYHTR